MIKASFSIEASIVFSSIIIILFTIIYISMYLHDVTVIKGIINEACHQGIYMKSRQEEGIYILNISIKDCEKAINNYIRQQLKRKLIFDNISDYNIDSSVKKYMLYKSISVTVTRGNKNFFGIINYFVSDYVASSSSKIYNKSEIVRVIDFVENISDNTVKTKRIKEKYKGILNNMEMIINSWRQ